MASTPKRLRTKSPDVPSQGMDTDVKMSNLPDAPSNTENSFMTDLAYFFSELDQDRKKVLLDTVFMCEIMMKQKDSLFQYHVAGSMGEFIYYLDAYFNDHETDLDLVRVENSVVACERHLVKTCDYELCLQFDDTDSRIPGYVKLKQISRDQTVECCFYSSYNMRKGIIDEHNDIRVDWNEVQRLLGCNFFCSNFFHNGPSCSANIESKDQNIDAVDLVGAISCKEWPKIADEWLERRREYDWPAGSLIEEVVETGCCLVPVGAQQSRHKHLEWRISFVLAERLLIRRMNSMQRFVYSFIKTVKDDVFTSYPDIISSYIIKTTILWVSEENDVSNWQPNLALSYIRLCFLKILNFLQADFCPNYFMRTCNLFHAKYSELDRLALIEIITNLLNPSLFLDALKSLKSVQHAALYVNVTKQISRNFQNIVLCRYLCEITINAAVGMVFNKKEDNNACFAAEWLDHLLKLVKNNSFKLSVVFQEILTENLSALQVRAGAAVIYTQSSLEMQSKQEIFDILRHLIKHYRLQITDMSVGGLVQIAHVFFSFGLFENCLFLVTLQKPHIRMNNSISMFNLLVVLLSSKKSDLAFSSPVRPVVDINFYPFELQMLTQDLQIECLALKMEYKFYSKTGIACSSFNVTLDPVVYACYLKFKCLRRIEKEMEAGLALRELEEIVDKEPSHRYTALNLLGCCLWEYGYKKRAMSVFFRSARENKARLATIIHILQRWQ